VAAAAAKRTYARNGLHRPNVAIAGVTGAVGQEFLSCLAKRNFPLNEIRMLASKRSAGSHVAFQGEEYVVEELTKDSFEGVDIALFSAGGAQSKAFAKAAVEAGAVVVDNSSAFRMHPDVPLVVPEVNPGAVKHHKVGGGRGGRERGRGDGQGRRERREENEQLTVFFFLLRSLLLIGCPCLFFSLCLSRIYIALHLLTQTLLLCDRERGGEDERGRGYCCWWWLLQPQKM
jgi:hypothetical protein